MYVPMDKKKVPFCEVMVSDASSMEDISERDERAYLRNWRRFVSMGRSPQASDTPPW